MPFTKISAIIDYESIECSNAMLRCISKVRDLSQQPHMQRKITVTIISLGNHYKELMCPTDLWYSRKLHQSLGAQTRTFGLIVMVQSLSSRNLQHLHNHTPHSIAINLLTAVLKLSVTLPTQIPYGLHFWKPLSISLLCTFPQGLIRSPLFFFLSTECSPPAELLLPLANFCLYVCITYS